MSYVKASEVRIETIPVARGVPWDMFVEYCGLLPDGRQFVICRPREDWDYDKFVCVVDRQIVAIEKVIRYRDGGTTIIRTELGEFKFPTPFDPELKALFGGTEIIVYERP